MKGNKYAYVWPNLKLDKHHTNQLKIILPFIALPIFAGLMVGPLEGFADVWGTAFLNTGYGLDSTIAAGLPSMMYIGMCFGSPLLSFISERVGSYLLTIIGA